MAHDTRLAICFGGLNQSFNVLKASFVTTGSVVALRKKMQSLGLLIDSLWVLCVAVKVKNIQILFQLNNCFLVVWLVLQKWCHSYSCFGDLQRGLFDHSLFVIKDFLTLSGSPLLPFVINDCCNFWSYFSLSRRSVFWFSFLFGWLSFLSLFGLLFRRWCFFNLLLFGRRWLFFNLNLLLLFWRLLWWLLCFWRLLLWHLLFGLCGWWWCFFDSRCRHGRCFLWFNCLSGLF